MLVWRCDSQITHISLHAVWFPPKNIDEEERTGHLFISNFVEWCHWLARLTVVIDVLCTQNKFASMQHLTHHTNIILQRMGSHT